MRTSRIVISLVVAATVTACAQIQGLDGYEKVDCLDNCTDSPDATVGEDVQITQNDVTQPPIDSGGNDATADADAEPVDAGNCMTGCNQAFTCCSNTCVNLDNDEAHCGACGAPCSAGLTCCNKGCLNAQTNNSNCGACGVGCVPTETCTNGSCQLLLVGDGADGAFAPNTDTMINSLSVGVTTAAINQDTVTVGDVTGFATGQLVFLHQTRGTGAGAYEYANIASVDAANKKLVMVRNLAHAYSSAGDDRAQVVLVHRFTTVTVPSGVTVRAPAWDGTRGGILVFKATGAVQIDGALEMSGRGFRGFSHASVCAGGALYVCNAANTANGFSGESAAGPSGNANAANGAGGGGGQDGQDCAGGGGGAYGAAGAVGTNGDGLVCRNGAQLGGGAGAIAGAADLRAAVLFGGAGGEGGGDEDGAYPGAGGNGGGIVFVDAQSIVVTGAIRSNGATGANGVQVDANCGGSGCGMGGGGGGAGGAVRLRSATTANVGTDRVTAAGAIGGGCTCDFGRVGGTSGVGRIGISATVTGTTSPTFNPN